MRRSNISPKSYRLQRYHTIQEEISHDSIDEPDHTENNEKIEVQERIQQRMNAMNNQYIELDDSDIEDVQEILREDDSDSEIEWEDYSMPLPSIMKTEPDENVVITIPNDIRNAETENESYVSRNICSIGIC